MSDLIVSRRSLGGNPPREEVICRTDVGRRGRVRNIVVCGRGEREYTSVNGLWLPLGLPPPCLVPRIPRIVWQTHKSDEYVRDHAVLSRCTDSWEARKGWERRFHSDKARDAFVKERFPGFWSVYTRLPLEVMKADLWRYMILYTFGGVYADADTWCVGGPDLLGALVSEGSYLVTSPEPTGHPYFCQWVFAAAPGSPVLRHVLSEAGRRLRAEGLIGGRAFVRDPHLIHRLTGPAMFTDAIRGFWAGKGLPLLDTPDTYARYPPHLFKVLSRSFHKTTVRHASLGSTEVDGWQAVRDGLVVGHGGVVPPRR